MSRYRVTITTKETYTYETELDGESYAIAEAFDHAIAEAFEHRYAWEWENDVDTYEVSVKKVEQ